MREYNQLKKDVLSFFNKHFPDGSKQYSDALILMSLAQMLGRAEQIIIYENTESK